MIEAFGTLKEIQEGVIKNHRQLLAILTDDKNYDLLRKGRLGMTKSQIKRSLKEGVTPQPVTLKLIDQYSSLPDWNRIEKIKNNMELTSSANNALIFPDALMKKVHDKDVQSVFAISPGTKGIGWFCIAEVQSKVTKKGKSFMRLRVIDNDNNSGWLRIWGKFDALPDEFTLWIGEIDNDANWGMASTAWKIKQIKNVE